MELMPKRGEILKLRRQLARAIVDALGPMGRYCVAPSYGIPGPRYSELARGQVGRCSLEWLIERVYRMGGTVAIEVVVGDAGRAWHLAHASRATRASRASLVPKMEQGSLGTPHSGCATPAGPLPTGPRPPPTPPSESPPPSDP